MNVAIIGSRSITSFDLSEYIPPDTDLIITGGAAGVDCLAEAYADKHRISKLILRPKYKIFGKCAPLKRNCEMIDAADKILIIWDGISRGSKQALEYAKEKSKNVQLIILASK